MGDLQEHGGRKDSCVTEIPSPAWVTLMTHTFLMLPTLVSCLYYGQGLCEPRQF